MNETDILTCILVVIIVEKNTDKEWENMNGLIIAYGSYKTYQGNFSDAQRESSQAVNRIDPQGMGVTFHKGVAPCLLKLGEIWKKMNGLVTVVMLLQKQS